MRKTLALDVAGLVDITVDGAVMRLPRGAMLATALASAGIRQLRRSPRSDAPRGAFCFMGACQECVILVDGALRQACMTPVAADMAVQLRGAP
jgi:D-hydroxyproline dehydrogenase subunit gamma